MEGGGAVFAAGKAVVVFCEEGEMSVSGHGERSWTRGREEGGRRRRERREKTYCAQVPNLELRTPRM